MSNAYNRNRFANREKYLESLADDYGVDYTVVYTLASVLGENEDFDGLINALEDEETSFLIM